MDLDEKIIALCVGHSRAGDEGALSVSGESEWHYNQEVARIVAEELADRHSLTAVIVDRYEGTSYGQAMRWLGHELQGMGNVGLAVELHFNSFNGNARGHEWLHWEGSRGGKRAALELHLAMSRGYPGIPARGLKPRTRGDRGAGFLRHTPCPAVIAEPFFGDSALDWSCVGSETGRHDLARVLAAGLATAAAVI